MKKSVEKISNQPFPFEWDTMEILDNWDFFWRFGKPDVLLKTLENRQHLALLYVYDSRVLILEHK